MSVLMSKKLNLINKLPLLVLMLVALGACQTETKNNSASTGTGTANTGTGTASHAASPGTGTGTGTLNSALLVQIQRIEEATEYKVQREFIGRVEATRQSQVGFELPGELKAVLVDEGDVVSAGQVLAKLDTARLDARLAEAKAALAQAESAATFSKRSFERSEEAASFEGISAQELDLARDQANAARAQVDGTLARLNSVKVDIRKSRLVAPYDAIVVARTVDEGNIVAGGTPVLHLMERSTPEIRVGVAADHAATLAPGQIRSVTVNNQILDAVVHAVLPMTDPATRTIDVILKLPDNRNPNDSNDSNSTVVPGSIARLQIEQTIDESGFWLPAQSLTEGSRGLWNANIVRPIASGSDQVTGATHRVESRSVEVLYQQGQNVFVRGALTSSDHFVTGGMQRIVPNQEVRVSQKVTNVQNVEQVDE